MRGLTGAKISALAGKNYKWRCTTNRMGRIGRSNDVMAN